MALGPHRHHRNSAQAGVECRRGAAIGAANGLLLATVWGASAPATLLGAAGAGAVGALIALLIWSASGAVPEDRVVPPRDD